MPNEPVINLEAPTELPPHIWTDAEKLALHNAVRVVALLEENDRLARELEQYKHDAHALLAVNREALAGLDKAGLIERELAAYKQAVAEFPHYECQPVPAWVEQRVAELMKEKGGG